VEKRRPLVAIVEDEDPVRRALDRVLRASRLDTAKFASGDDLLADLERLEPDCVLLDLQMPGLDGYETQARLAVDAPAVPVVVLTAQDCPRARERVMRSGAAAFLTKPVEGQLLVDTILAAIARAAGCAEQTWRGEPEEETR
jgi:FixJ family two-component response regulator